MFIRYYSSIISYQEMHCLYSRVHLILDKSVKSEKQEGRRTALPASKSIKENKLSLP